MPCIEMKMVCKAVVYTAGTLNMWTTVESGEIRILACHQHHPSAESDLEANE
jgi:hypothetical protein